MKQSINKTRTNRGLVLGGIALMIAAGSVAACGDDGDGGGGGNTAGTAGSAGSAGSGGSAGSAGSAGSGGSAAGNGGSAGSAAGSGGSGNGGSGGSGASAGSAGSGGSGGAAVLARPSKSSTISISSDDAIVAMVNPADDSVSVFTTADNTRTAKVATGDEPSAVVIHPDNVTAFVANAADASVVKVSGIDTGSPTVSSPVAVGSEPTGLALSPTGKLLFVAEWAESRVSVIDTDTMTVTSTINGIRNPRGLAVTNNGDASDDDESLVVPEFFGEIVPGGEMSDTGRKGKVRVIPLSDFTTIDAITFEPRDSGFGTPSLMTSPNQLHTVAIAGNKIYVPSISVSPEGPAKFNENIQPVLYVADLAMNTEDVSNVGTVNLATRVRDDIPSGTTKFFLADMVDISFVGDSIGYALSRGANVVQRIEYNSATGIAIGSAFNKQIDIGKAPTGAPAGCEGPTGIVTGHSNKRAYVNCWVSRRLGVVDLEIQEQTTTVEASNPPSGAAQVSKNKGLKFFFTGRARWSDNAWSSCASCHPGGLSDGVTWSFAAGPRQTVSLDGSFSRGATPGTQRIFNWTGIFDEIHDFERNTRGVSGGKGAVTTSTSCGDLAQETPSPLGGPPDGLLGEPVKEVQDTQADNCTTDWDDIELWIKDAIRPPKALQGTAAASVTAGAQLFVDGGCAKCHGGDGWTVSRRFWDPSTTKNNDLKTTTFEIAREPGTNAAPLQVACAIRNIETFGIPGNSTGTTALELRPDGTTVAQGRKGYNVPSLYGLALGAPYFHHGQAATLKDVFADPKWQSHLQAGSAVFVPTAAEIDDLVAYLLSIDKDTTEVAVPAGFDVCRTSF